MQYKYTIAIDPGASGGIAYLDADGIIQAVPMPDTMTEQIDFLRSLASSRTHTAIVEKTGTYMPGNSGPASCTFARHCGHVDAALYTLGIPTVAVPPASWMKLVGALPKDKRARKNALREFAARRFPHLHVTLKTADALALFYVANN